MNISIHENKFYTLDDDFNLTDYTDTVLPDMHQFMCEYLGVDEVIIDGGAPPLYVAMAEKLYQDPKWGKKATLKERDRELLMRGFTVWFHDVAKRIHGTEVTVEYF